MDWAVNEALNELNRSEDDEQFINTISNYIEDLLDQISELQDQNDDLEYELQNQPDLCNYCKLKLLCTDIVDEEYKYCRLNYTNVQTIKDVLAHQLKYGDN